MNLKLPRSTFPMWNFASVVAKEPISDRLPMTSDMLLAWADILKACAVRLSETTLLLIRYQLIPLRVISKHLHEQNSMSLVWIPF